MYASRTDYAKLYSPAYFGKEKGVASFDAISFCDGLVQFCLAKGIAHVVDIGSGSGVLAHRLRQAGLEVLTCDFEPAASDSIHFDLSGCREDAAKIYRLIYERTGHRPWLVTCLDVLEHIDAEDVYAAVRNLRIISTGYLIASISTRPSSRDNRFHATIIPLKTWMKILTTIGFRVDDEKIFQNARQVRRDFPLSPELCLVSHWAKVDPFGDIDQGEPSYLLLSIKEVPPLEMRAEVDGILDVAHRNDKRQQFNLVDPPRLGLNIHHPQDFILLRPILDVLPREKTVALVRTTALRTDELSLIRGFFYRCGVSVIQYERIEEIRWTELDLKWMLSGGESSVAISHILSRQLVEAAKLNGIATLQLQHGIWVETFPQRMISFGSDVVLSWSHRHADFFRTVHLEIAGKIMHGAATKAQQFRVTGGPKFTDALLRQSPDILRWRLGINIDAYRRVVLLGTNLFWGRHRVDRGESYRSLAKVIDSAPDIFFIVKLHPSERASDAFEFVRPNSLVLDDIILGSMDLHVSRLLASVDVVVSSLSTLLLDAAVAGKPCVQYDTRNDYSYSYVDPVDVECLPRLLTEGADRLIVNKDLARHYAELGQQPFYRNLSELLVERRPPPPAGDQPEAASFYSVAVTLEELSIAKENLRVAGELQAQELHLLHERTRAAEAENLKVRDERESARASAAAAEIRASQLAQQLEALREMAEAAGAESTAVAARLHAMERSKSWRITAPLRRVRNWL